MERKDGRTTGRARASKVNEARVSFADRPAVRYAVFLLCLMVAAQGLMRSGQLRALLDESIRLGSLPSTRTVSAPHETAHEPVDSGAKRPEGGVLYLRLLSEPEGEVWALVNGHPVKRITEGYGALACCDGDLIEIHSTKGEANVLVTYASDNLSEPSSGSSVKGDGTIRLGTVKTAIPQ